MENKNIKLKDFVQNDKKCTTKDFNDSVEKLQESDGLFERMDKKLVNGKGQTLLREKLYESN